MLPSAIKDRSPHSPPYQRHQPERTLLYQIVEQHYPEFRDVMAMQGKALPVLVQQEFADYLKCGRFHASAMHALSPRAPGRVQLQASWLLPQLRRETHGRKRRAAGR